MSIINYIEVNSSYRDRNIWAIPSDFDLLLMINGSNDKKNALDPVCDSAPIIEWNNSFGYSTFQTSITGINPNDTAATNVGDNQYMLINTNAPTKQFITTAGYYNGAIIDFGGIRRRILTYNFLSSTQNIYSVPNNYWYDQAWITTSSIPDSVYTSGIKGVIGNPTTNTTLSPNPQIFIPSSPTTENYYVNTYITNINTSETYQITYYNNITHLATLSSPTDVNWATGSYNFMITNSQPSLSTTIIGVNNNYYS